MNGVDSMRIAKSDWACVIAVMLALAGCGGGGGGDPQVSNPPPSGGGNPPPGGGGTPPPPPGGGGTPPPGGGPVAPAPSGERKPILFVTQAPASGKTFTQIFAAFGNHLPDEDEAPRGGDLMIAYPPATADGAFELRNLTQEAGFGMKNGAPDTNQCGSNMVSVREPAVSWNAQTALVSMVVGCDNARWQIYEVSGLNKGDKVTFTQLQQPAEYNNVSPIYSPEGNTGTEHIIFTSDIPSRGTDPKFSHLKHLDEYERQPSTSGIFKLDRAGKVTLLHAAPSGAFTPIIDAFGRVVFTNWDHLDEDNFEGADAFNYLSEEADAAKEDFDRANNVIKSVFPDRREINDAADGFGAHNMKVFLPWEINPDGTAAETLNHIGRHEFGRFIEVARTKGNFGLQENPNQGIGEGGPEAMRMMREDPLHLGRFYSVYTPEFPLCGGGAIKTMEAAPTVLPKDMTVTDITDPKTYNGEPAVFHSPLPTATGELWAAVGLTPSRNGEDCTYRITKMAKEGKYFVPAANGNLTPGAGLTRTLGTKTVTLWEWEAVEVRARTKPEPRQAQPLGPRELKAFADVFGPDPNTVQTAIVKFREFLAENNLAAIVSYNLTWREKTDKQQLFNLRVRGSTIETKVNNNVTVVDIDHLQVFTGQQLRGNKEDKDPDHNRRVLAQPAKPITAKSKVTNADMDVNVPPEPALVVDMPGGSVPISKVDGSMAALVEARRATTWQTIDSGELGDPVLRTDGRVRERMWLSFQPGEVRVCVACHGGGDDDVAQNGQPLRNLKNIPDAPDALVKLLTRYRDNFYDGP